MDKYVAFLREHATDKLPNDSADKGILIFRLTGLRVA
jgi:hypothetical protein